MGMLGPLAVNAPATGQETSQQIGAVRVDYAALTVTGPEGVSTLEPKVMAVLQVLAQAAPAVVTREALIERVWGQESGGDESLSRAISLLRKALGDRRGARDHIETIPRRGYRMVAVVGPARPAEVGLPTEPAARVAAPFSRRWRWLTLAGACAVAVTLMLWVAETPGTPDPSMPMSTERSVAVLPFADLSDTGDQGYFADGLAEEILSALTRVPELKIAGRTSTFAYKGRSVDLRQVGRELGVSHILEGSVRKAGDALRITAQLVRTEDGFHSWSGTFDGDLRRVFDFQEAIARDIADALQLSLDPRSERRLAPALTANEAAYDTFLQGRSIARRFDADAKLRAAELLEQAVQLDPDFALAWAELSRTELFIPVTHPDYDPEPHMARARAAAARALRIDPDLAMGHFVTGLLREADLDFAGALESLGTAYRLDPRNPFLSIRYGYHLALIGQTEAGAALMEEGLRRDPTDAPGLSNLAGARLALGDLAGAERLYRRSVQLGFAPAGAQLSLLLRLWNRPEEARRVWNETRDALPGRYLPQFDSPEGWDLLGRATGDDDAAARQTVRDALDAYLAQPDARLNSYRLALLLQLGQPGKAMKFMLERPSAVSGYIIFSIWFDAPASAAVRQHPDFPAFAERIGLVEAWERHGWPAQCQPTAPAAEHAPGFRCI